MENENKEAEDAPTIGVIIFEVQRNNKQEVRSFHCS